MRSASSSTTTSTSARETSSDFRRSIRRNGVATTISTPSLELVDLVVAAGAAVDRRGCAGRRGWRPARAPRRPGRRARGWGRAPGRAAGSARPRRGCGPSSARRRRASCPTRCGPGRRRRARAWRPGSPRSGSRTAGRSRRRRGPRRCAAGTPSSAKPVGGSTGGSRDDGRERRGRGAVDGRRRRQGGAAGAGGGVRPAVVNASVMVAARLAGTMSRDGGRPARVRGVRRASQWDARPGQRGGSRRVRDGSQGGEVW